MKVKAEVAQYGYQVSYNQGLKTRPEATELSSGREVEKLAELSLGSGVHEYTLSDAQRKGIMNTLMFMKDKFDASGNSSEYKD